jgi:hypothetical protein
MMKRTKKKLKEINVNGAYYGEAVIARHFVQWPISRHEM